MWWDSHVAADSVMRTTARFSGCDTTPDTTADAIEVMIQSARVSELLRIHGQCSCADIVASDYKDSGTASGRTGSRANLYDVSTFQRYSIDQKKAYAAHACSFGMRRQQHAEDGLLIAMGSCSAFVNLKLS